jgi:hypothetical protein
MTRYTIAMRALNAKGFFMKKIGIIAVLFLVLMLAGCPVGQSVPPNSPDSQDIPVPPGFTKVRIPLPGASNARAVGLEGAKAHSNFFEVALRDSTTGNVAYANAPLSKGCIEVAIAPGVYDILLFAGDNSIGDWPLLLATSHKQDVEIVLGQTNDISMTLVTFDVDFIALPSEVKVNEVFTAGFTVKPRNPLLAPDDSGALPNSHLYITVDGDGYFVTEAGYGGGTYTYTESVSVKTLTGGTTAVIYFEGLLGMFDLWSWTGPVWYCMTPRHSELGGYYRKEVTVARTGGNITIDWETDGGMVK